MEETFRQVIVLNLHVIVVELGIGMLSFRKVSLGGLLLGRILSFPAQGRLPGILLHFLDGLEQELLFCLFGLPGVLLEEAEFLHVLLLHEAALHAAFEILHLEVAAALGHELMFNDAV